MNEATLKARYPIRTVTRLTGINPVTLRAWERRYGLVKPERTPKGHRLYSDDDIRTIEQIMRLLDQGVAISQAARHLDVGQDQSPTQQRWQLYRQRMLDAIAGYDEPELNRLYEDCLSLFAADTVTERLLVPVLNTLGERWQDHPGGVAEEHFFTQFIRNRLGARIQHSLRSARGPRLLVACLPGETHEIGALLFALHAAQNGCRPILLGADLPLKDLLHASTAAAADAVVLSAACPPADPALVKHLKAFRDAARVPVFAGGRGIESWRSKVEAAGIHPLGSDIGAGFDQVVSTLSSRQ